MSFLSWQRAAHAAPDGCRAELIRRRPARRRSAAPFRCPLEILEDRTAPAVFTVATTTDGGPGSLRQAIIEANASHVPDTIVVPAGIYALTLAGAGEDQSATGDLDITGQLTISGAGAGDTIIDASSLGDRVFDVLGGTVTISGVTIRNGSTDTNGGGILNEGALTIRDSTLSGNSATFAGGAIYDVGALTIRDSTLSGNSATFAGGGVYDVGDLALLSRNKSID